MCPRVRACARPMSECVYVLVPVGRRPLEGCVAPGVVSYGWVAGRRSSAGHECFIEPIRVCGRGEGPGDIYFSAPRFPVQKRIIYKIPRSRVIVIKESKSRRHRRTSKRRGICYDGPREFVVVTCSKLFNRYTAN